MNPEQTQDELKSLIEDYIIKIEKHKTFSNMHKVPKNLLDIHNDAISYFNDLLQVLKKQTNLPQNYLNNLELSSKELIKLFPFSNNIDVLHNKIKPTKYNLIDDNFNSIFYYDDICNQHHEDVNSNLIKHLNQVEELLESLFFSLNIFKKLNFFKNNIVAIGANGSGKSILTTKLDNYLYENSVSISSQRILIMPTFENISKYEYTKNKLDYMQKHPQSSRKTYNSTEESQLILLDINEEFKSLLENLIAENSKNNQDYINQIKQSQNKNINPINSTLYKVIDIWNNLITHRVMTCQDGINIRLQEENNEDTSYSAYKMSDGEKVTLYLIAQILQAPKNGFIIVDEPEIYLHKSILNKLWNILEKERNDCIFIYLTHDLEFATTRQAKKVWIKSFHYPDKWEIVSIDDNDILPKKLILELLGSRRNILFCEGDISSLDYQIYSILFPHFSIKPVGSCESVINYTKAFNKLPNISIKAFGLIDKDYHSNRRIESLLTENIYSYNMAEIENILLIEDFLFNFGSCICIDNLKQKITEIKNNIIDEFYRDMNGQIANYISIKINNHLLNSNISRGKDINEIKENYNLFIKDIDINKSYKDRENYLNKLYQNKDYNKIIKVFNHKGLKKFVNNKFNIKDFHNKAITFLKKDKESQILLRSLFPEPLSINKEAL